MIDNKGLIKRKPIMDSFVDGFFKDDFDINRFDSLLHEVWDVYDTLWKSASIMGGSFAELRSPIVKFPKINVKTLEDCYEVDIAVAGFDKDDVSLELKDNCLYIKAEKSINSNKESEGNYLIKEIANRSFRRCIAFPEKINTLDIKDSVSFLDGIIKCKLKKLSGDDTTIKLDIN